MLVHAAVVGGGLALATASGSPEPRRVAVVRFAPSEPAPPVAASRAKERPVPERREIDPSSATALREPTPDAEPFTHHEADWQPVLGPREPLFDGPPAVRLRPEPAPPVVAEPEPPAEPSPPIVASEPPAQVPPPAPAPEQPSFVAPQALDAVNRPPTYPAVARRRGYEGEVVLRLAIDADGNVLDVTIARPSRYPVLDRAALRAARQWRFSPARRDGLPVAATKQVPVEFRLTDAE